MKTQCRAVLIFVISTLLVVSAFSAAFARSKQINVCSWPDFFPEWLLTEFYKETGYMVVVTESSTNGAMRDWLKQAQFDLVTPSSDYVHQLVLDGLIQHLDISRITNHGFLEPRLASIGQDSGRNYFLPIKWGLTGIVVSKKALRELKVNPEEITSVKDLWRDEFKGKVSIINDLRTVVSLGLLSLGYDINDIEPDKTNQALERIVALQPNLAVVQNIDTYELLHSGQVAIAYAWTDSSIDDTNHDDIMLIYPKEKPVAWADGVSVVAKADNLDAVYLFLNYIMRPEVGARMVKESGYAPANTHAIPLLSKELRENRGIFPPQDIKDRASFEKPLPGDISRDLELRWDMVKNEQYKSK